MGTLKGLVFKNLNILSSIVPSRNLIGLLLPLIGSIKLKIYFYFM